MLKVEIDESTICNLLTELLELSCSEHVRNIGSFAKLDSATNVISGLTVGVRTSARLRKAILFSLSTNGLSKPLHYFLSSNSLMSQTEISHDGLAPCPCSSLQKNIDLRLGLCTLILKTALCASQDEISLDYSVSIALLDTKMDASRASAIKCNYYSPAPMLSKLAPISCFQPKDSPSIKLANHSWKENLFDEMSMITKFQHESVIKMVRNITKDLEDRCNITELPFREEQERSRELDQKLKSAESKLAELEIQMKERNLILNEIKLEKVEMLEQTETAEMRFQSLSNTYEALQRKVDCIEKATFEAARAAKETAKQKDLAHMAILTGKDELYEEQALKVIDLEARVTILTEESLEMRSRRSTDEERINYLEKSLEEKEEEFKKTEQSESLKQIEIDRFIDLEAKEMIEKQGLIMKVLIGISGTLESSYS